MKKKLMVLTIAAFSALFLYAKPQAEYELNSGNLKLKVFEKTGNFCLYSLSSKGKVNYIPLYDDRSLGRNNKFYVFYNGKIYELKKRINKPLKIAKADNAITVTYDFSDKFFVVQKLSFTELSYGTSGPLLKIETVLENVGGDIAEMALKAVFDTNLGEKRRIPLYTDLRTGIFKETIIEPKFEKDSAVISAGNETACMFLIQHSDATMPENVYAANWERLQTIKWIPNIVQGRSFSTKYFHNDSALLFVWPKEKIENKNTISVSMLIGYFDYIKKTDSKSEEKPAETVSALNSMTEKELKDYTYIQKLLEKIADVENSPDSVSEDYIKDLTNQADKAIHDIQE